MRSIICESSLPPPLPPSVDTRHEIWNLGQFARMRAIRTSCHGVHDGQRYQDAVIMHRAMFSFMLILWGIFFVNTGVRLECHASDCGDFYFWAKTDVICHTRLGTSGSFVELSNRSRRARIRASSTSRLHSHVLMYVYIKPPTCPILDTDQYSYPRTVLWLVGRWMCVSVCL